MPVSKTTSPVTQTEDVAVNSEFKNDVPSPVVDETGSINKNAPKNIIVKNPNTII